MTAALHSRQRAFYRRASLFTRVMLHQGGNTLMIGAAALIPLTGMIGGAMDMSRLWLTKTRMQHGCDAAVLAGRKQMGGGLWNDASRAAADQFFKANFAPGAYGSTGLTTTFSESGGKVLGSASVTLPMTLMRVLGISDAPLTVVCNAEMRLPNTDVMFVLDTTGSMNSPASPADVQTKIQSLRNSVKCFYEILAKLPTDAVCTTSKPIGGTTGVQIRFGFVPYATNVNVGRLLPTAYVADRWPYQSREVSSTATGWGPPTQSGDPQRYDGFVNCPTLASTPTKQYSVTRTVGYQFFIFNPYTICTYYVQNQTTTISWRYAQISQNVSGLKNGTSWNAGLTLPIGDGGSAKTIKWDGCIEERATVPGTNFTPIPAGAKDLDIDSAPTPGDASTYWGPALPDVLYTRQQLANPGSPSGWVRAENTTTDTYVNAAYYSCPTPARKLQTWSDPSAFDDYVDGLRTEGNTYHDIGILWGARLISPTGIFAAENARTPQGGDIQRHMIFMTDGDTSTSARDYAAYGIPWFDARNVANPASPTAILNDEVNARFSALCTAVKNKNITLWVISFGDGSNAATEARLAACATSGSYYFKAADSTSLQSAFNSIANQISQLRLTK
jgi:Flp pilus assembly protein TadG